MFNSKVRIKSAKIQTTYLESKWLRSIDSPSLSHWISGMGFPLAAQSRVTSEPCKAFVLWGVARNKGDSCSVCLPGKRKMEFVMYFLLKQCLNFVSKILILSNRNVWNSLCCNWRTLEPFYQSFLVWFVFLEKENSLYFVMHNLVILV